MLQISLELNEHSAPRRDSFEIPKGLELQKRVVTGWRSWYFEARNPAMAWAFQGSEIIRGSQRPARARREFLELIRSCDNVHRPPTLLFFFGQTNPTPCAFALPFCSLFLFPLLACLSSTYSVPIRPQISPIGRVYPFCSAIVLWVERAFG